MNFFVVNDIIKCGMANTFTQRGPIGGGGAIFGKIKNEVGFLTNARSRIAIFALGGVQWTQGLARHTVFESL